MTDPHLDSLLEQARWVRELARKLVRDPDLADDLAQDAMVIALEHAESPPRSMRAWLASIVRHRLWERMRTEDRRSAREEHSARDEAQESTAEVVARASAHRSVVETVMELPEAYRDVLLLRYFEGETPTAIAQKTGVPVATVKTRLQRGLAAMRERLDQKNGGDGKRWLSALAPLLRTPAPVASSLTLPAVIGLVLFVGGTAAVLLGPRLMEREAPPPMLRGRTNALPRVAEELSGTDAESVVGRELPARSMASNAAPQPTKVSLPSIVKGTVRDIAGLPVAGVVVRFEPDSPDAGGPGAVVAVSDDTGNFELSGVRGRGRVRALSNDLLNLYSGEAGGYDEWTPRVVVARRVLVAGRVLDPDGLPLAGAHVEARWPSEDGHAQDPTRSWRERFATATDEAGAFQLEAPRIPRTELIVALDGHEPHAEPLPAGGLTIVTLAWTAGAWIRGRVLDGVGNPLAGTRVSNGREERRAGDDGSFRILAPPGGGTIVAARPGRLPAFATAPAGGAWPEPLELRLQGDPLEIAGRVVDRDGNGLRGVRVSVEQPTVFLARTREATVTETWRDDPDPATDRDRPILLENLIAEQATSLSTAVETGENGTFVLRGLLDRPYTLVAIDPLSLATGRSEPTASGARGVRLELTTPVVPRIEGRVLDRSGNGVGGVTILPFRTEQELHQGGQLLHRTDVGKRAALSDTDGSFFLSEVSLVGARVRVEGPDVVPLELALDPQNGRLELRVDRSAVVTFVDGPRAAGEVVLVDAAGEELFSSVTRGGRRVRQRRWPLEAGSSPPMLVSTTARELVVYVGTEEALRITLSLSPGERRTLRP